MMGTHGRERGQPVPIARLLEGRAFTPEQTRELVAAYERLLGTLNLTDRTDPFCEQVAGRSSSAPQVTISTARASMTARF
jgi:hypothetical protein